jgi:hypothetical protein
MRDRKRKRVIDNEIIKEYKRMRMRERENERMRE